MKSGDGRRVRLERRDIVRHVAAEMRELLVVALARRSTPSAEDLVDCVELDGSGIVGGGVCRYRADELVLVRRWSQYEACEAPSDAGTGEERQPKS